MKRHLTQAYALSGEFKSRLDGAGLVPEVIDSWEAFCRIPVLRKKELPAIQASGERLGGLLTLDPGQLRRLYLSPGAILDPEGRAPDYWGWAEAFQAAGFRPGDLVQMTFSYHLTPAGHMLEEPLQHLGCAVIPAGPGNTEQQVDLLAQLPVTGFVGMTSFLRTIGERARARGLEPRRDFRLRNAFVAAERLPEALRAEVERDFGITVRQGYGTADVGAIAYECPALGGMHATSRGVTQICDPATGLPVPEGEVGEVVFTPFCRAYPLIRLATGDLSRLLPGPCPCGRTSPRLGGILGRVDDTVKVKGQFLYPAQAAQALAGFQELTAWRVVVDNPGRSDRVRLQYAARADVDTGALEAAFRAGCKLRPLLERVEPGDIAPDAPRIQDERTFD